MSMFLYANIMGHLSFFELALRRMALIDPVLGARTSFEA